MLQPNSIAINLEPTFRCNLFCAMCPRFSSVDPHLDMSMETYARIVEGMHLAHTVDFTGWGEPMLHPHIYDMVRMAKEKDCVTTMTSNGTVLNSRNAARIIEAGMNRLTVSVDGLKAETFEAVRPGASFEKVTDNLRELSRQVEAGGHDLALGVAFTIQEVNAGELPLLVPWLTHVGAKTLHLKHLNVVSTEEDWNRSFLKYRLSPVQPNGNLLTMLEASVSEVLEAAEKAAVEVLMHSEFPMDSQLTGRHCLAAPFQSFRRGFETGNYPEECRTCYLLYGK